MIQKKKAISAEFFDLGEGVIKEIISLEGGVLFNASEVLKLEGLIGEELLRKYYCHLINAVALTESCL